MTAHTFLKHMACVAPPHREEPCHFRFIYGHSYVSVRFNSGNGPHALYLAELYSTNTQKGYGTLAMEKICELADRHHVRLSLDACSFGPNFIPQMVLERFYRGFNFKSQGGWIDDMVRRPNTPKKNKKVTFNEHQYQLQV